MKLQFSDSNKPHALVAKAFVLSLLFIGPALGTPGSDSTTYSLDKCIVTGEVLGEHGDVVVKTYNGREVRFCCKACIADFEKDKVSFMKKLDEAIVETQLPLYPLQTCIVSGEPLDGAMGAPVNHIIGNRLIRLCCSSCKQDLAADPAQYIAKLDTAVTKTQLTSYPSKVCPITGQQLGAMGDPFNYVFAGRLVRFCCAGCIDAFNDNPTAAITSIYGAMPQTGQADMTFRNSSTEKAID